MKILRIFMILSIFYLYRGQILHSKNKISRKSLGKPREVETFTTILLDDEAYSIQSVAKKLKKQHDEVPSRENDKILLKSKVLNTGRRRLKANRIKDQLEPHGDKLIHDFSTPIEKNIPGKKGNRKSKHGQMQHHENMYHRKSSNNLRKKLQKRHFDAQRGGFGNFEQRYDYNQNSYNQNHRSVLNYPISNTTALNSYGKLAEYSVFTPPNTNMQSKQIYDYNQNAYNPNYQSVLNYPILSTTTQNSYGEFSEHSTVTPTSINMQVISGSNSSDISHNSFESHWERDNSRIYREPKKSAVPNTDGNVLHLWTDKPNFAMRNENNLNINDTYRQKIRAFNINPQPITTTEKRPVTTTLPSYSKMFIQGDIMQRSPSTSAQQQKSEKKKLEEQLRSDEAEAEDASITFGGSCEQVINETCCITREVGDVLTLSVLIQSSKDLSSFQVRWLKVYHIYGSKKGKTLEIQADKLPWNMVSGSEGRELRLNPVTNTDVDPNRIVAKVFLLTKQKGKVFFTFMKRLIYRIEIPVIDMGKIYSGEELSINLENFISLPERGNMLFDWNLETRPHEQQSLPSNIKVSNSGRSVVLKELKKGRLGILNCVIYSSNRYSVAKRRFNILKIEESVKRRSIGQYHREEKLTPTMGKNLRCRRLIRKSREQAMHRLEEGTKPKSRKKRFKRMEQLTEILECEPLRKKMYSRWIRSLFGESTTTDPRLMPLEKLFELSEEGDGTLDDVIPHEIHYVPSKVRFESGTSGERSVNQMYTSKNCTSDADCGNNSICAVPHGQKNASDNTRYCFCRAYFYNDGYTCQRIPLSNHREKRLRRNAQKDFAVPEHQFYAQARRATQHPTTIAGVSEEQEDENAEFPPKVLAFEEEESFLLSDCIDDKDCSSHASCVQPTNGHPYCKCRPGFRGNGIFCWEIMDYVPPEENFLMDEEVYPKGLTNLPDASINRLSSRTPTADELEE